MAQYLHTLRNWFLTWHNHRRGTSRLWGLLVVLSTPCLAGLAQEPLHQRIDASLTASQTGPVTGLASDAEFFRRLHLDLVGTIPAPAETRAFLADASPEKRAQLVDRLMADPRFAFHWAEQMDVLLMERRTDKYVPHAEWLKYLQAGVRDNKPWNQLAQEIFTADGTDPATRPAAKFFLDRDAEAHILTRDVGRIFFGVDLQCAQCHDHPLVDHYAQSDYYGLFACVNRTVLFNDEAAKLHHLGEKADGNADFQSVFTKDASRSRPRLFGGPELNEPHFPLGEEYVVAPADKVRPVPKFSSRQLLTQATDGTNAAFNRNLPNRLWATLFGRGLVHPVDWHHPHNPPASPETLDLLTSEFVASGFNIRELIRQLVLTQAYQRSIDRPAERVARLAVAPAEITRLEQVVAELETSSTATTNAQGDLYDKVKAARDALKDPDQTYQKAVQAALALKKPLTDAQAALAATQGQVTQKQAVIAGLTDAVAKGTEVVKLLPKDAEVAQASTIFTNKLTAANTELTALQATATTQTEAVTAAQTKWNEGVAASETAYQAYVTAAQNWETLKQQWQTARDANLAVAARLEFAKAQLADWKTSREFGDSLAALETAKEAVPVAQTQLTQAQQAMAEQQVVVTTATTAVTVSTQERQVAQEQLDASKAELAARQTIVKPVTDALASLDVALQQLAGDAELLEVQTKLKGRSEPLQSAVKEAEGVVATRTEAMQTATSKLQTVQQQQAEATTRLTAMQEALAVQNAALAQAQTKVTELDGASAASWEKTATTWEREFSSRVEKALTPEQLTYAIMSATGVLDPQRAAADQEIEKTIPAAGVEANPDQKRSRDFQVHQLVRERMRGNVNVFVGLYGGGAGQPQDQFFATADQALFVGNGGVVLSWLAPSGNNLAARLTPLEDPSAFADELYTSILARPPRPEETTRVAEYVAARPAERPQVIQELIWALLSSAEFRFNL